MDVALASCRPLPEPDPDEPLLLEALRARGLDAQVLAWNDPEAAFAQARWTILRSTWNYPHHLDSFLSWVERLDGRVLNPVSAVRWNAHKSYLSQLSEAGIPTVPTMFVRKGNKADLHDTVKQRSWSNVVVKPAVSAGSFGTRRVDARRIEPEQEAWFARLVAERDMMVQPYLSSVEGYGERAVVWIAGQVSHAVRKQPRFLGQDEAVSEALTVSDDERRLAEAAMDAAAGHAEGQGLLYGRVDVARDDAGEMVVMELELIEPSLFFRQQPEALARFADSVVGVVRP